MKSQIYFSTRGNSGGIFSLFKLKFFKYYILIILLILLVNAIVLLRNLSPLAAKQDKLDSAHVVSDVYKERGPKKLNKKYENNARRAGQHGNVSDEIHRDILYELDMLDMYFLVESRSEYIQNKYRNLVAQLRKPSGIQMKGSWKSQADELNDWLLHQMDKTPTDKPNRNQNKQYLNLIGQISHNLCHSRLVKTDLLSKGTQLKFLLTLAKSDDSEHTEKSAGNEDTLVNAGMEIRTNNTRQMPIKRATDVSDGNQLRAVFKPKWYDNTETFPNVVDGKDRHYGELVGFLLSLLLEIYSAPLTLIKTLTMSELVSTAGETLNATHFVDAGNRSCFVGKCLYCTRETALCSGSTLSGALILYVETGVYHKVRHPYQRSYVRNKLKPWEVDASFCFNHVVKLYDRRFVLDIVDIAVFDFLIQNGDRHHLEKVSVDRKDPLEDVDNTDVEAADEELAKKPETIDKFVLFDNGKSFGNPSRDNLDILAPLYQCCVLRSSTYNRLVSLRGGLMIRMLKSMSEQTACGDESGEEVMSDAQWRGMTRRLNLVYATVNYCVRKHRGKTILVS